MSFLASQYFYDKGIDQLPGGMLFRDVFFQLARGRSKSALER